MRPQIIGSLALLGSVSLAAANDVVSLMLPMVDQQDLVAEVIGSVRFPYSHIFNAHGVYSVPNAVSRMAQ